MGRMLDGLSVAARLGFRSGLGVMFLSRIWTLLGVLSWPGRMLWVILRDVLGWGRLGRGCFFSNA